MVSIACEGIAILCVIPEASISSLRECFTDFDGVEFSCCLNAPEALIALNERDFGVLICDHRLVGEDAVSLFEHTKILRPNCVQILISGARGASGPVGLVEVGSGFRSISAPCADVDLRAAVDGAIREYFVLRENSLLKDQVGALNLQLASANTQLEQHISILDEQKSALNMARGALKLSFEHSLGLCFRLISTFYPLIGRQTHAVVEICRAMVADECFSAQERHVLISSSWMYDIGLVALERPVLHRLLQCPEACSREEQSLFRHHTIIGQTLATFVDQSQSLGATIRAHHERFDGTGYPDGLAGESIPWAARCLAVAVAFVQTGMPKLQAAEYLQQESGRGFDPEAVRLFFKTNPVTDLPLNIREVLLSDLQAGMRLARGILTPSGMLLIPAGQELNAEAIEKLQNHSRLNLIAERILISA